MCPTELQAFADLRAEFVGEQAVVVAASSGGFYAHKARFEHDQPRISSRSMAAATCRDHRLHGVAYPVIADTSHALSRQYGVLSEDGTALRGTFIVDPEGIVRHAQINDLDVGRNVEETLRTLRALRSGALCPVSWRTGQSLNGKPLQSEVAA